MVARNETLIKWALFAGATALACALQGVLQRLTLLGVMPFLFPAIAAIVAMLEGALPGTVFSLVLGVLCDLAMPAPLPCFYTLIFPVVGLLSALLAQNWISGFPCAVAASLLAFFLTDLFHAILLALSGNPAWGVAAVTAGKEALVTLPFMIPFYLLFRAVHRKCHMYD